MRKKDKDIKHLNESNSLQSKTSATYKDEIINRLREDIKNNSNELESLKREYQKVIERNEGLMVEIGDLKKEREEKEANFQNLVKLNNYNDDLLREIEKVKRDKIGLEESFSFQRASYKQEIEVSNKRVKDLERRLSFKDGESMRGNSRNM